MKTVALLLLALAATASAQTYTRGIGVYPGDPRQDFSPASRIDATNYRNLALHRPAYHSSSYDYNLTAQLVTDGIVQKYQPRWIAVSTSDQGVLKKNERERILDDNWVTSVDLQGRDAWVQIQFGGAPPSLDRIKLDFSVQAVPDNQDWRLKVQGSLDGREWTALGTSEAMARPAGEEHTEVRFAAAAKYPYYRLEFESGRRLQWHINEASFWLGSARVHVSGPHNFDSAWMSAGAGLEWIYVDLGAQCTFDRVNLAWIERATEGALQVSDDARTWRTIHDLSASDIRLTPTAQARFVRVLMTRAEAEHYILSELEVFGRGGPVAQPVTAPPGGVWRVQRDSLVAAGGAAISRAGFVDRNWIAATVPATVLSSYWNAGALPDPNFGDNQLMISDSFFYADFWYRTEFVPRKAAPGLRYWLNFGGINWKAEVWLNGAKLGRIEGGFTRGRFDVTGKLFPGARNVLAVRIEKNATPGSVKEKTYESPDKNGGAPGADNPTYHAAIGWDWIPTIRGRDTGIWGDVSLTTTGGVTIEDPLVTAKLPDAVTVGATLTNHSARPVTIAWKGRFGETAFSVPVTIEPSASKQVATELKVTNPKLWWPSGYGDPYLYDVEMQAGGSDTKHFKAGIREFTYSEEGGALRMWINGRRFIPRGGNWGFPESMLRYRAREYDAAVRYHADMHFNMIRNWVGQTAADAFYEACDRHGIVVWQDFWLANPWDGPEPNNNRMFMQNVRDTVARIRNHPSIGLYCGRNEGYPLKTLDEGIRKALADLHPGIHYISSSADDVVSGHGPYQAQGTRQYFEQRATPKFHSEMGMPNIVSMESLRLMMPESAMWPMGAMWGLHDFCLTGAQGGQSYLDRIAKSYGGADNVAHWVTLAQFVNYEGYRAMFEAQSKNRMGLLIWMSHPAWPSMVWQTYDYYLEPTAGYFGAKTGAEPLHIQWNPATEKVEVVNYSGGDARGLTARVELFNLDGSRVWDKQATLDSAEDSVAAPIAMDYPMGLTAVHFLRLTLSHGDVVSRNFYWRGLQEDNFQALRTMPKVTVDAATSTQHLGATWMLTTTLRNTSAHPALLLRLQVVRAKSGDRILPAIYSDNYLSLMPGESRMIRVEVAAADTRGEEPRIIVGGFNVK